ncbi:hypothetical protein VB780_26755 [Leptolyngbya sp. CCNP1308]|nr:hypothetical protein [Leptolyngbya sp. CCNP1308]MEA5452203.1 hypothetical protein [Leptolyngbya sp. CCNP1308]
MATFHVATRPQTLQRPSTLGRSSAKGGIPTLIVETMGEGDFLRAEPRF